METVVRRKYRYQDEDAPHDHSLPRLTHEVRGPELVHVSEKNLSQIENVHGYVLQSHISPLKTESEFRPNQIHLCSECNTQSVLVPVNWLETDLTICEPSWEVDCAAASPRIPSVGSAMFASIWYAKKLGRRFVHNARKAKSEKEEASKGPSVSAFNLRTSKKKPGEASSKMDSSTCSEVPEWMPTLEKSKAQLQAE
ncbi:hypothetical protein MG293_019670 [Ovis ammon polii]|uniref:Disks large homologue 1 N-terminal PEST domain-containing protein n=1 Tax=Ovis ammon polii TaxID=230172 RepID=A0AAD4TP21_OVIAM|nr:hypothetical protein MG293_019670 [Ovis ammon polii]